MPTIGLTMKALFGMALRQTSDFVREPAAPGRPRLDGAGFQHAEQAPEDVGRVHSLSRLERGR